MGNIDETMEDIMTDWSGPSSSSDGEIDSTGRGTAGRNVGVGEGVTMD